jgi:hypothetical protein
LFAQVASSLELKLRAESRLFVACASRRTRAPGLPRLLRTSWLAFNSLLLARALVASPLALAITCHSSGRPSAAAHFHVRAPMPKLKAAAAEVLAGMGELFAAAVRLGLVSGAAVSAFLGQFLLAGVLAALALGLFIRLWRGKVAK